MLTMNCARRRKFEGEFSTERIDSADKKKYRPLKVRFDCKSSEFYLLAKSKKFKYDENYFNVFIVPNWSREERTEHRK